MKRQLQKAFSAFQWPTPVPDAASFAGFNVSVVDDLILKSTPPAARADTTGKVTRLSLDSTGFFAINSAKLLPAAASDLATIAAQLNAKASAGSTVTVFGYVSTNDAQTAQQELERSGRRRKHGHGLPDQCRRGPRVGRFTCPGCGRPRMGHRDHHFSPEIGLA